MDRRDWRIADNAACDNVTGVNESVVSAARQVRSSVLLAVCVALAAALALVWKSSLVGRMFYEVSVATGGLVQPTLLFAGTTALLVCGVLVAAGVPLRELGVRTRDAPRALALLVVLYAALQLAIIAVALAHGDRLAPAQHDLQKAIGLFAAQLFGNALVEEAVFRGFLFRQLVARARLGGGIGSVAAATALAAAIFGVWHLPLRIHQGYQGLDLAATIVVAALGGALASYLYARSGNLLILVVLHTLFNEQAPLFVSPVPTQWILCVLVIAVVAWIEVSARAAARHLR